MENSKELYEKAYELHYKKSDLNLAYYAYKDLVEKFPDKIEAKYAYTQILNIENNPGFIKPLENQEIKEKIASYKSENMLFQENLKNMIVTSGFNFEGYRIIEYVGFISSEIVVGMGAVRGLAATISNVVGADSEMIRENFTHAKIMTNKDLKSQAAKLGANAIIGIDIDCTMFMQELVAVIMSGTAVVIEKSLRERC